MNISVKPSDAGMDESALVHLDAAVKADIDAGLYFGASLLVARGGNIVHRSNIGTAAAHRALTDGDLFLLMSMSKTFTAALILRAIEEGRFRLDTPVEKLLPGFGKSGKALATVEHLLCHTAGLPTALVPPPIPLTKVGDLELKAEAIKRLKAVYEPGTRCAYTSGTGYDALGQILVETDPKGRSFRQIAKEEIFDPLGMRDTSFGLSVDNKRRVPVSFTPSQSNPSSALVKKVLDDWMDEEAEFPAGGAYGTIEDVFLFTEALIGRNKTEYQLLSPAMFDQARTNKTGSLKLEAIPPRERLSTLRQVLSSTGLLQFISAARAARGGEATKEKFPDFPANFTLLGGYVRGEGDYHTPCGRSATPSALAAVGGGSTGWVMDTERDLTFIFLSAGFMEGLAHPKRLSRLSDLAIAAVKE